MSDLRIEPYIPERRDVWNHFIETSSNGTLFHRIDFLGYHPCERFDFHHLMFYRDDNLLAVLPGGIVDNGFRSPVGATFGGFVFNDDLSLEHAHGMVSGLVGYCRNLGLARIALTPPMHVYCRTPNDAVEYALAYHGFAQTNPLYSSVIDLHRVRDRNDLDKTPRYCVRKSEKMGVSIVESDDIDTAYAILLENKKKFSCAPTHSRDELQWLMNNFPDRILLFLAVHEGRTIAAQILFLTNNTCALVFYSMHQYEYRRLFAVNHLAEYGIRWCVQHRIRYLDFGVSQDTFSDNPLEPSWPLVAFKESMGSAGCIRRTFRRDIP